MTDWFESFYRHGFFGHSLVQWAFALGGALLLFLIFTLLLSWMQSRLSGFSRKTETVWDDLLAATLESTKRFFLGVLSIWAGSQFLELDERDAFLDYLVLFAVVIQASIWANRMVSAYIAHYTDSRRDENPAAVSVVQGLSFVVRLVIWSLALLLLIDNLGYDVTALVAGLGISGIAVALALQNILGDLFASLSIVLDKPFVIGDFIIVGDMMGVVDKIGLKTTRIRSLSGEQLIFSNSDLLNSRIRNFKRMQERRVPFSFGVIYQTTPEQLEAIPPQVKSIIEGIDGLRFDRAHFKGFGESSYDFEVVYYINTPDYNAFMDAQQTINLALCRAFKEMQVEFAYPTRTLYLQREGEVSHEVARERAH
jgi:small-conductance mechanosensitive channel